MEFFKLKLSKTFLGVSSTIGFVVCIVYYSSINNIKEESVMPVRIENTSKMLLEDLYLKEARTCPNLTEEAEMLEKQERKRILFWTPVFRRPSLRDHFVGSDPKAQDMIFCEHECEFTTNHDKICQSDIILFHGFDIVTKSVLNTNNKRVWVPDKVPLVRKNSQYWIFFYHESPAKKQEHFDAYDSFFNMTISYRRSSDFYQPYGRLINLTKQVDNDHFDPKKILEKKTDLVAWAVSSCNSPSQRKKLVNELGKYVKVDIYGSCGNKTCPPKGRGDCYGLMGETHKFYLAFENSLCEEYVTEKFFNALKANMVPVVYGGANYSHYAPVGSYINVDDFATMKELAEYLLWLDKNDDKYLAYFDWRKSFEVVEIDYLEYMRGLWCSLCEKLHLGTLPKSIVKRDLNQWWYGEKNSPTCFSASRKMH